MIFWEWMCVVIENVRFQFFLSFYLFNETLAWGPMPWSNIILHYFQTFFMFANWCLYGLLKQYFSKFFSLCFLRFQTDNFSCLFLPVFEKTCFEIRIDTGIFSRICILGDLWIPKNTWLEIIISIDYLLMYTISIFTVLHKMLQHGYQVAAKLDDIYIYIYFKNSCFSIVSIHHLVYIIAMWIHYHV